MGKRKEQWFRLVSDDSGHDYVVPVERSDEWDDYDWEENEWEAPEWATRLGGSGLQFQTWREHYD